MLCLQVKLNNKHLMITRPNAKLKTITQEKRSQQISA
jgi:hypothetical protein